MDRRTRWYGPLICGGLALTACGVWNWMAGPRATSSYAAEKPRAGAKDGSARNQPVKVAAPRIRQVAAEEPATSEPYPVPPELQGIDLRQQTPDVDGVR